MALHRTGADVITPHLARQQQWMFMERKSEMFNCSFSKWHSCHPNFVIYRVTCYAIAQINARGIISDGRK
jgi:hypothetical protein